jgi:phosphatidylserine decarboxylase
MLESRSDPDTTPTMGARLFVWMQYLLPQHALSRLAWHITRSRNVLVKNFLIGRFISGFRPDMSDAEDPEPLRYGSFNDFFTRALRPGARPIEADPRLIVSPVDGTVSAIGAIHGSQLMQAKGRSFSVAALLASDHISRPVQLSPHPHAIRGLPECGVVRARPAVQRQHRDGRERFGSFCAQ